MKTLVKDQGIIDVFNAFPFGVLIVDPNFRIIEQNNAASLILEETRGNLLNKKIEIFLKQREDLDTLISKFNSKSKIFELAKRKRYIEITKTAIASKQGSLLVLKDITSEIKEKIHHEETEKELARLASIPTQNPNPIFEIDTKGKILYKNPSAEHLFSSLKKDFIRKNLTNNLKNTIKKMNKKNICIIKEIKLDSLVYEFNICHLSNNLARVFAHDVTVRKESEQRRDYFVGMVSHELKNPLTNIKAFAQLLGYKYSKFLDDKGKSYLQKIDDHTDKITRLVNELLDVVKIRSGKIELYKELFDLDELLKEVIDDFTRINSSHKIIKKEKIREKIYGDKQRISQVIQNLLSNASKYSPNSDRIEMNFSKNKDFVFLAIKDYGVGIPEGFKEKIFQPFFRLSEESSGVGLGLFIASEIIKAHNGKLELESQEGKGSVFTIALPLDKK